MRPPQHAPDSTEGKGREPASTAPLGGSPSGTLDTHRPPWSSPNRSHDGPQRGERIRLRLTSEELAALASAAHASGLTVSGYAAEVVVAAVTGGEPPRAQPLRAALADLLDARAQLRRLGTNVHLAVGATHRDGRPPTWLEAAIQDAATAVRRVDEAAAAVTAALSRNPR